MTDSADKPATDSTGIGEALITLRQLLMVGLRLSAPILFAIVMALPITLFVAVMFDTFPDTRWLAILTGVSGAEEEVEHSG